MRCLQAYYGGDLGAGHLPWSGGYLEQPAALMDAIMACGPVLSHIRKLSREQAKNGKG